MKWEFVTQWICPVLHTFLKGEGSRPGCIYMIQVDSPGANLWYPVQEMLKKALNISFYLVESSHFVNVSLSFFFLTFSA